MTSQFDNMMFVFRDVTSYQSDPYSQKLCRVKWFLAMELPLFSKIMQTRYHSKELSERNSILARDVKFCSFKGL